MRSHKHHILFIATEYAAGMRPYASTIIRSMWQEGDHVIIVAKGDNVKHDMDDLPGDSVTWVDYPTAKWQKLAFRFRPTRLMDCIEQLVSEHGIHLIYSLTGELILVNCIKRMQRMVPVLYTIHDALSHDSKFEGVATWLKHKLLIAGPQRQLIKRTHYQVTNSKHQQRLVNERFPYHKVYYAPFPTLITDEIAHGQARVPELNGINDGYILFFGNVQLYKGIHLLYDAYLSHPELQERPLVIAGAGYIYFKRRSNDAGVTFINRFIEDAEVKDLMSRAAVVVYPYISATQSGVMSIASFFGKPMVLSDVPYFKQTCDGCQGIEFFTTGDREDLAAAVNRALLRSDSTVGLYNKEYAPEAMHGTLQDIVSEIIG